MFELLSAGAFAVCGLMLTAWILSLPLRDVSVVDIFWGLGFCLVAWTAFAVAESAQRDWLTPLLCTVWGVRLSGYLAWRNHGEPEDRRYREMRERHGRWFPLVSLGTVFGLQGVVMWVVSLPLMASQLATEQVVPLQALGGAVWLAGLLFESIGDWQLARFRSQPENEGKVLSSGLWRYTRHPNYFGDFLVWWGLYAAALGAGAPWWTAIGPAVMSVFLMRISGVTLLEKSLRSRKPEYEDYMRRTNAFFPGPPKT